MADHFPVNDKTLADVNKMNHDAWDFGRRPNSQQERVQPREDESTSDDAEAVPGLQSWSMHAGGTAAAAGKHGYTHSISHGEENQNLHTAYSISPISNEHGRHVGYHVGAWSPKAGQPGHKSLGTVRDPRQGVKLAAAHYAEHFGGK
jgi:hypothetical protein